MQDMNTHAPASHGGPDTELLIDERTAARRMGLSPRSLFSLRRKGLPHIKIGSRVLYSPSDLRAWIERRKGAKSEQARDGKQVMPVRQNEHIY